jgi:hypothetical protein
MVIQHGVPEATEVDNGSAKSAIGSTGRAVVLTFGLLSPAKGIEVVLDALPSVVSRHPEVLYIVVGATHPQVRREQGEEYRDSLAAQVVRLGLEDHVRFEDRYVDLDELCLFLAAADIYVTPYHSVDQIVSGTLAYAVGTGRAVVSTPYPYAQELLADGRGRLVPYADPAALATEFNALLDDTVGTEHMRSLAFEFGRQMTWPAVAQQYATLFAEVVDSHQQPQRAWQPPLERPSPSFAYLRALTDDTGVFKHAWNAVPDRVHGYCTDDVGRALVAAIHGVARRDDPTAASLVPTYLSFLKAAQREDGRFDNLLGYDRRFVPDTASEDTLGQALWGLGTLVSASTDDAWRAAARAMFDQALAPASELIAPRAAAYAISGLYGYLERLPGALAARRVMQRLATGLESRLDDHRSSDWHWFEPHLTYANAKKPHALLLAGRACENPAWIAAGVASLDFLIRMTFVDGRFDFVGNAGWYPRGGRRAEFGQQPIEAGYTAEACIVAYEITGASHYLELAHAAVEWLVGRNRLGVALYDPISGRCADGLDRHGASANAGAESTVCALLALLAVPAPARVARLREERPAAAAPE